VEATPDAPLAASTRATAIESIQPASAVATVELTSPAGQYRPGGTSSYNVTTANQHVEVATRPSATTTAPEQPIAPASSVPWTPPGAAPSGTGTRTL
jgi:hypothetical protein